MPADTDRYTAFTDLRFDRPAEHVLRITLDGPGLNATGPAMHGTDQVPRAQCSAGDGAQAIVEVAVTLPVPGRYHYLVPAGLEPRACVGSRVLVRFGRQQVTGVVVPTTSKPPIGVKLVKLGDILDDEPALSAELVDLCLWIADYYEAPAGEVMKLAAQPMHE